MVKHAMCSIAQIKWIIKVWEVFSKDWPHLDLGDVLMSLIDWSQKYCLYVQFSSNQLQMQ